MTWFEEHKNTVICGDAPIILRDFPDGSIGSCVTSPPYWGLRDYGTATWEGGDEGCNHIMGTLISDKSTLAGYTSENVKLRNEGMPYKDICKKCGAKRIDSQIGLEKTPEEYVEKIVTIFREIRRVLKPDGTCWLNLGDSYSSGSGGYENKYMHNSSSGVPSAGVRKKIAPSKPFGLPTKNLVGIPWRVAFALQKDGWYLRQDIVWSKPNPMPESVQDRCTKAHEYIFLFTKNGKYYYDYEAIKEPDNPDGRKQTIRKQTNRYNGPLLNKFQDMEHERWTGKRNKRSVWTITTKPSDWEYCSNCKSLFVGIERNAIKKIKVIIDGEEKTKKICPTCKSTDHWIAHFATFPSDLIEPCIKTTKADAVILDPFMGAGTVAIVAHKLRRNWVGVELNPDYVDMASKRIHEATRQMRLF